MEATVFQFLEEPPTPLPQRITIERSKTSSYQFYLIVRHFRKRTNARPQFHAYAKAEAGQAKSLIEEHSLFAQGNQLHVMEGFSREFVDALKPPKGVYIVAETDNGELKTQPYGWRTKRGILKTLYSQLSLGYHKKPEGMNKLTQRGLIKLDWSMFHSHEELEPFLRKAKILEWDDAAVEEQLNQAAQGNLLTLIKKGRHKELFELAERLGANRTYHRILELLGELLHYRVLRTMGYDEAKCAKEVGAEIGYRKAVELEEANNMLTADDLTSLCKRAIQLDQLAQRNPELGLAVFCLNTDIRVRR